MNPRSWTQDPGSSIPEQGSKLGDFVRAITECYPKEIVDYYSPNYSKQLLDNLDASELQQ